jgi:methyl-accepting chemotaxis protein
MSGTFGGEPFAAASRYAHGLVTSGDVVDAHRTAGRRCEAAGAGSLVREHGHGEPSSAENRARYGGLPPAQGGGNAVARGSRDLHPRAMALDLTALETSFDLVAARGDELVDTFYARLFAAAPAVRPLFADSDLQRQKVMLLGALVLLRKSLRDLDAIVPKLRDMGARHVGYGAEPAHYPVVGEVLIASMAEIAGDAWRPAYSRAWADAYGVVAGAMLDGAAAAEERLAA